VSEFCVKILTVRSKHIAKYKLADNIQSLSSYTLCSEKKTLNHIFYHISVSHVQI